MTKGNPDELSAQLQGDEDDVLVLDVRHQDDYGEWPIPDSVTVDVYDELIDAPETAKEQLDDLSETARSSPSVPRGSSHRRRRTSYARWTTRPRRSLTA